jgi:hypothetical protein
MIDHLVRKTNITPWFNRNEKSKESSLNYDRNAWREEITKEKIILNLHDACIENEEHIAKKGMWKTLSYVTSSIGVFCTLLYFIFIYVGVVFNFTF